MNPCQSCHAGCCRAFAVPVTGADILRIEREQGLSFWEFACRWADPDGAIARNAAPHFRFADEPQTPFVICLRHDPSRFLPGTTKCRFLAESPPDGEHPLGRAHCGIYGSRPLACRVFPTRFNETGDLAVLYDVPASGRSSDEPAYSLCPRPWEPEEVDPLQSVQDLAVARYESAFFQRLAALWNRSPGPWPLFPEFLHLAYSGRVQSESDLRGEAEPAILPFPTGRSEAPATRAA